MKPHTRYIKIRLFVALLLTGFFLGSCAKSSTTNNAQGPGEIWIQNDAFNPGTKTVPLNTTVKWTNKDNKTHTVTSDAGAFDSGILYGNGIFSYTFSVAGTYHYHCTIHPLMKGMIVVQ